MTYLEREQKMGSSTPEVGEIAPDFEILTAGEEKFQLKTVLKNTHNTLLVFYRGHW